jgi:hypothetical protein
VMGIKEILHWLISTAGCSKGHSYHVKVYLFNCS